MKIKSRTGTRALVACCLLTSAQVCVGANAQSAASIGIVDFYGLRTLSQAIVRQALQLKEGDSLASEEQAHIRAEQARVRLQSLPGVVQARLNFICCDADRLILYVGIEEQGAPSLHYASAPQGKVRLPRDVVAAGAAFDKAFAEMVEKRDFAQDDSEGYALFHYPAVRSVQQGFPSLADRYTTQLRDVLHHSDDAGQRALAAQVIAYAAEKQAVVADLVGAMNDADGEVRNNATRALWLLAGYAQRHPELHLQIPAEPFIRMLNSIDWTDRNKSSLAMAELTEKRDPAVLSELRKQALPALSEMARWKSDGHAQPAFFILGRVEGLPEEAIKRSWDHDRGVVLSAAAKSVQ